MTTTIKRPVRGPNRIPYNGKKLTYHQVDEIKDLLSYMRNLEIAPHYGVSVGMISQIRHGACWKWV